MSSAGGPPPLPKLPVWEVVGLAYSDYFGNFIEVLRTSSLWLVLEAALFGVMSWQQWSLIGTAILNSLQHAPFPPDFTATIFRTMALAIGVANLVLILASVSIAVAWHRRVILGERPPWWGFNIATKSFWRYIGIGLAIWLLAMLPILFAFILLAVILSISGKSVPVGIAAIVALVILAAYVTTIAIMLRLSLLLPARATGDLDLTFKRSWNRTRGNGWRIFWGVLICVGAPMIVVEMVLLPIGMPRPDTVLVSGPQALQAFFTDGSFAVRMTVVSIFLVGFYLLTLPIGIGFLSLAYRHFFREAISPMP